MNTITTMNLEMAEVPAQGAGDMHEPLKNTPTADETPSGELPAAMESVQPALKPAPPEKKDGPKEVGAMEEAKAMAREKAKAKYRKAAGDLMSLVQEYAIYQGLLPQLAQKQELTAERAAEINRDIETLTPEDARAFNSLLAMYVFGSDDADLSSLVAATR
jgi:hypothetical protein